MVRVAVRRALAVGYKRVGLVTASWWDNATDQACSAGYLAEQRHLPENDRIPLLTLSGSRSRWSADHPAERDSADTMAIAQWIDDHQPDLVLAFSPVVGRQLKQLGLRIPAEIGYIDLCLESFDGSMAGFRQNSESTGELAMAALVGQLQLNSFGIPRVPTTTLVGGAWIDGSSLTALRVPDGWTEEERPCIEGLPTVTAMSA
jgi:LacI family transcriptional regulator